MPLAKLMYSLQLDVSNYIEGTKLLGQYLHEIANITETTETA